MFLECADNFEPRRFVYVPSKSQLIIGGKKGEMGAFDLRKNEFVKIWKPHRSSVRALSLEPESEAYFLSGSSDCDVRVWDASTLDEVDHWASVHESKMFANFEGKKRVCSFSTRPTRPHHSIAAAASAASAAAAVVVVVVTRVTSCV